MKLFKVFFMMLAISMFVASCGKSKKEEITDDAAVEMNEAGSEADAAAEEDNTQSDAGSQGEAAGAGAAGAAATGSKDPAKGVDSETKDVEELKVPEGVIAEDLADTPVIYPGCAKGSVEETRACSKAEFIAFLKKEFDQGLAEDLGLNVGDHDIRAVVHIDETGKMSTLRVSAPHSVLEKEMERVIGELPTLTPATKDGKPVGVTFMLPLNFKVTD